MKKFNLRYFQKCRNHERYVRERLDIMTDIDWYEITRKCVRYNDS